MADWLNDALTDWLLAGDPAVVWQVQRDLLDLPETVWSATRQRVATEGWGARLLAHRDADGTWGGGLYQPKWTGTFYTLQTLLQLGADPSTPAVRESSRVLLDAGVRDSGAVGLWSSGSTDTCVAGMLLTMASDTHPDDDRLPRMAQWLIGEQMADGGWNCQYRRSRATHGSFHTTLSVLEGLAALPSSHDGAGAAGTRGRQFLLRHRLYRSHRTGEVARKSFTMLSFPTYWYYDVLRALEHFRAVDHHDDRLEDALSVLWHKRRKDGRWPVQNAHSGKRWFVLEPAGKASRVNTVRILRVLRWDDEAKQEEGASASNP